MQFYYPDDDDDDDDLNDMCDENHMIMMMIMNYDREIWAKKILPSSQMDIHWKYKHTQG